MSADQQLFGGDASDCASRNEPVDVESMFEPMFESSTRVFEIETKGTEMTRTIRMVALCATLAMSTGALAGTHSPAKVAAPASKAVAGTGASTSGYTWGKSGNGYTWGKSGNGYTWGKSGNGYTWGKSGN